MPYPDKYTRNYGFKGYQDAHPNTPLPGVQVDAELDSAAQTTAQMVDFVKQFTRADGRLANHSVGVDQLAADLTIGFKAPTTWAAGVDYAVDDTVFYTSGFYQCSIAHTSGSTFAPEHWDLLVDFGAQADAAALSATAAAGSAAVAVANFGIFGTPVLSIASSPPGSPAAGARYLVAHSGTSGVFVGKEDQVAQWSGAVWLYSGAPTDGQGVFVESAGQVFVYRSSLSAWKTQQAPMLVGLLSALGSNFVPAGTDVIQTTGYAQAGIGAARYVSTSTTGATAYRKQTANGRWFELAETVRTVEMFGAIADLPANADSTQLAAATDNTAAISAAINYGPVHAFGRYKVGVGNTQISVTLAGTALFGRQGQTEIRAAPDFTTSSDASAHFHFLFRVETAGVDNVVFEGIYFRLATTSSQQSKILFSGVKGGTIRYCRFEENGLWDVLYNACTDIKILFSRFECGVSGSALGSGARVCGKSDGGIVFGNYFGGALVTQKQQGLGVQPSGDKWASVGMNIDCSVDNHSPSNKFQGGMYRLVTDGIATSVTLTIPGVTAVDWKAWVEQPISYNTLSGSSLRRASVAVTTDTITISSLPASSGVTYDVQYAYFGATPRNITVEGNEFAGCAYAGLSIINGINIQSRNNRYRHIGDVAFDPEGSLAASSVGDDFEDCAIPAVCCGWRSRVVGATINDFTSTGISVDADGGAAYQAFGTGGNDFWSAQLEVVSVSVAAPSGSSQVVTGSSNCFKAISAGEWFRVTHSGDAYEYLVSAKASNNGITVDKSQCRLASAPRTALAATTIPTATYAAGLWKKSPYREALYGLQGDTLIAGNTISCETAPAGPAISGTYVLDLTISANQIGRMLRGIEVSNGRNIAITGGKIGGRVYAKQCAGFSLKSATMARSTQRGVILDGAFDFQVADVLFHDNEDGNASSPGFIYGNCSYGSITGVTLALPLGDSANQQPTIQQGIYNNATNTVDTSAPNNTVVRVSNIGSIKNGAVSLDHVEAFTSGDTSPSVQNGEMFTTANAGATSIAAFDDTFVGKKFSVVAGDANTTLVNSSALRMKSGANVTLASGQGVSFKVFSSSGATEV